MRTLSFNVLACATLLGVAISQGNAQAGMPAAPTAAASNSARPATTGNTSVVAIGDAANWGPVQVVVYKSLRTLAVYRSGAFAKEYPVVLGLEPVGRKRHANDARTPEGLYHVIARRPHERWQVFLALDYPNADDRRAYDDEVRRGKIPDENGAPFSIGGSVGIHGNDREARQEAGVNWTKGCIALKAADIAEVAKSVPVDTPVWIVE